MSKRNNSPFSGAGGYCTALIVCACVLGLTGLAYYGLADRQTPADQPVIATQEQLAAAPAEKPRPRPEPAKPEPVPAQTQPPTEPSTLSVCAPVEGETLADYAAECLGYNATTRDWRTHKGIDIGAPSGTEVVSAAEGEVYTVYADEQMGQTVVIRHPLGYTTKYQSLAEPVSVSAGDRVEKGQAIGTVGSTALMESALGDHVHFSVTKDDMPMDPGEFLGR